MCPSLTYASIFLKNLSVIKIQDGDNIDRHYVRIETSGGVAKCQLLSQAGRKRRLMENTWRQDLFSSRITSSLQFSLSYCGNVVTITKGASSPDPVAEKDVYISLLI